ncbi:MAG: hypothetical protein P8168_08050, partial [Deltaproteobacteria bacterium]
AASKGSARVVWKNSWVISPHRSKGSTKTLSRFFTCVKRNISQYFSMAEIRCVCLGFQWGDFSFAFVQGLKENLHGGLF